MKNILVVLLVSLSLFFTACEDKEEANTGDLALNFQLQYKGNPLVMFDRYEYPNGMEFFFTRFSFYLSNLEIASTATTDIMLKDIEFLNLTEDHESAEEAANGTTFLLENIPIGDYRSLTFNIGVPPDMNAQQPKDYPSDHPLSSTGEYWDSWNSYIFSKTEGKLDADGDGQAELGLAYHIGSDETLRNIDLTKPFSVKIGETTRVTIIIEMERMFDDGTAVFDPLHTAQIHSLTQLDEANVLADNLQQSFE